MRSLAAPPMVATFVLSLLLGPTGAAAQQPAVPQPFPTPGSPARPGQPSSPAPNRPPATTQPPTTTPPQAPPPAPGAAGAAAPAEAPPTEAKLGMPIYPQAQFIASYNAGQGQRYYLFGTAANYTQVVTFYRGVLKQRGEILFEDPPMTAFDVGRYREETMAFPPGVTVKDYTSSNGGYLNPKAGTQPERFPTVIQIVPAPGVAPQ